jgi:hypothetical protein
MHNLLSRTSPFSWRALFAFITITALSTFLLETGKLTPSEWIQMMQWISGFFITGETIRKFTTQKDDDQDVTVQSVTAPAAPTSTTDTGIATGQ